MTTPHFTVIRQKAGPPVFAPVPSGLLGAFAC